MNKIAIVAVLALALTGLLFGQSDTKAMPRVRLGATSQDDPRLKDRLSDDCGCMDGHCGVNLSEAQQKKLEPLRVEHLKTMNNLQAEIENLRIDMQQALKNEDFANLKKLAKTLNDKQLTLEYARIDHLQQVYKELTPEQKENMRGGFMNMHRHGQFQGKNWNKAPLHWHGENCQNCGQHQRDADRQGKMLHRGPGNGEGLRMRAGDCEGCEDCKERDSKPQSKQDLKATPKAEIK